LVRGEWVEGGSEGRRGSMNRIMRLTGGEGREMIEIIVDRGINKVC
jgi:hypothetical protein